ncbi:hypothetical protein CSAL01_07189 [Colletotrichum salicis]|uniref:Uncharacterized protein n=1 Tax=Colletotrichum salicis TaxID=1209931 RepID=A0A135T8G1_9PEZI|nr:hypothetical protein CSAL01_07189 [Colletotrichum salicis]
MQLPSFVFFAVFGAALARPPPASVDPCPSVRNALVAANELNWVPDYEAAAAHRTLRTSPSASARGIESPQGRGGATAIAGPPAHTVVAGEDASVSVLHGSDRHADYGTHRVGGRIVDDAFAGAKHVSQSLFDVVRRKPAMKQKQGCGTHNGGQERDAHNQLYARAYDGNDVS